MFIIINIILFLSYFLNFGLHILQQFRFFFGGFKNNNYYLSGNLRSGYFSSIFYCNNVLLPVYNSITLFQQNQR